MPMPDGNAPHHDGDDAPHRRQGVSLAALAAMELGRTAKTAGRGESGRESGRKHGHALHKARARMSIDSDVFQPIIQHLCLNLPRSLALPNSSDLP